MTAIASRFVGRPVAAAPNKEVVTRDKWALVENLTIAAEGFGLSHRTITVLRTMLSFVPERDLPARLGQSICFASNDTLSSRLGGMPESTLRRHISALVGAGVILRHDSPNRKRYAKRVRGGVAIAFGFDLGPLACMADDIDAMARTYTARAEERAALHSAVLVSRQRLIDRLDALGVDPEAVLEHSPLLARTRLFLRRKDNNEDLQTLLNEFETALESLETSASNSQNERHQHSKKNKNSESVRLELSADNFSESFPQVEFREYQKMFPQGAHDWRTLSSQAAQLVPMMGIDMPVYEEAKRYLGNQIAPIVILCILEGFDTIRNPGGYLRQLSKEGRAGEFDLQRLIQRHAQ